MNEEFILKSSQRHNIDPTLPRYGTDLIPSRSLFSDSGQYRNAVASGRLSF
jgi:hypothetical protein